MVWVRQQEWVQAFGLEMEMSLSALPHLLVV